jgi:hypothetical protein
MMFDERRDMLKKIVSILKGLIRRYSEHHLQQVGGSLAIYSCFRFSHFSYS